jgi:hypothetical protein
MKKINIIPIHGRDQQTLTPVMSGPGNEAFSAVPPANTVLDIIVKSVCNTQRQKSDQKQTSG